MIEAVIFDMDGTMFNTQKMWHDTDYKLAAKYGIKFDEKVRVQMMGKKDYDSLLAFKLYFNLDVSIEELISVRRKMILEDVRLVQANKGLYELLDLLDKLLIKKAVATPSFREFASKTIGLFDLEKRFDTIVVGDDVVESKPNPAIFLEAAGRLQVNPANCLVLEDAQNGVEAAHRAGMHVFAIPHSGSKSHDFSKATKMISSMLDINETTLKSL